MPDHFLTYYQSPVGLLRIAGTSQYVSEVKYIDTTDNIEEQTGKDALPAMAILAIEQLIQYFHGNRRVFEFPVHQAGTVFQEKVWHELMNIPYGKKISYLELSRRLGDTKAIRAVGTANGKNNVAIVVPRHRVIGSNNELVGYAGGLWRKKWLLEHESKIAHGVQTLF